MLTQLLSSEIQGIITGIMRRKKWVSFCEGESEWVTETQKAWDFIQKRVKKDGL